MKRRSGLIALMLVVLMLLQSVAYATEADLNAGTPLADYTLGNYIEDQEAAALQGTDNGTIINVGGEVIQREANETSSNDTDLYTEAQQHTISMYADAASAGTQHYLMSQYGKVELKVNAAGCQWQVKIGEQWINVSEETNSTFTATYAKLQSVFMLNNEASAQVRCVTADGQVSDTATIALNYAVATVPEMEDELATQSSVSTMSLTNEDTGVATVAEDGKHTIVIEYKFYGTNTDAATSYTAQVGTGTSWITTVKVPEVLGYKAYLAGDLETEITEVELNYTNVQQDYKVTVYYRPALVDYKVIHYQQNINDDGYTAVETVKMQGLTNDATEAVAKEYTGFQALLFVQTDIAADGSTVVEIYYDRLYYLMKFDLDGGYGVEPIYGRYGAAVGTVVEPTKPGYRFNGWTPAVPNVIPAATTTYTAQWIAIDTTFTVVYWLENADNEKYSYWASYKVDAVTGDTVSGETYKNYPDSIGNTLDEYEKRYSEYSHADASVTVDGDGSTVVNIYYNRKEYTLKFYYAMSTGSDNNATYYVIGGSTYRFGATATITNTGSETALLDHYMTDYTSERGEVAALPSLNATGIARSYTSGSDTSTVNRTTYNYHYISFTAKYGADISELWPCAVFNSVTSYDTSDNWDGDQAFVSAWNGEHHVYYSQHNGNQTIKGNYNELDYKLLWDYDVYGDPTDNTITYLCFWENGANISWSVPELYRYNIYVPVVDGKTYTKTIVRDGVTYGLEVSYDTVDDSDVGNQTAPAMKGFTYSGEYTSGEIEEFDENLYAEAYEVNFFYTRNTYTLTFNNVGEDPEVHTIPYETNISAMNMEPEKPDTLEEGGYEFGGWYTTEDCLEGTKFEFTTMPANNVLLYAKWVPVEHEVKVYLTDELTEQLVAQSVLHNEFAIEPDGSLVQNGSYSFAGWFYMDGETEKAFDFANMQIKRDMVIYAKWSSNVIKPYFIYYVVDGQPIAETTNWVAEMTEGSGLAGTTKTFYAKGGNELYEAYRENYFPKVQSHSFVLDINGENTYVFEYVKANEVPYVVYYVNADTGDTLGYKVVADNSKAVVTENYQPYSGLLPDAAQKRLVVSYPDGKAGDETADAWITVDNVQIDPDNVLYFYYTEDSEHAYYSITHYTENLDGTWEVYSSSDAVGDVGTEYTAQAENIPGFTYDSTIEGTLTSGTLTTNGLELKLYYTRNDYPYEFKFLEQGTNKVLAESESGTKPYMDQISQNAKNIAGYTLVSDQTQVIIISNDSAKNVKIFYYMENQVTINYEVVGPTGCGTVTLPVETVNAVTGTAVGSTAEATSSDYKFVGWYLDEACTQPVTNTDGTLTDSTFVPAKTGTSGVMDENGEYLPMYVAATYYAKFEWNITDVTITKTVSGNMGDRNKEFKFKVEATGDAVKVVKVVNDVETELTADAEGYYTFKHGDTIVVKGVQINSTLIVKEWSAGYDGTVGLKPDEKASKLALTVEEKQTAQATVTGVEPGLTVAFTNTKNETVDTGVTLDSMPYMLLLAAGAGLMMLAARRRRTDN